ncbi:hypothetical protein Q7C36_003816 [Tachysurus vachellii]|uniref:Uncharacterized protein n=1 Tax=Tachysurus vachellii TaxID=175792 RepID=A0AA88NQL5_TACVA|nr:hypothetical protein Q7C36_003816 [Tachysurus vachellii]
MTRVVRPLIRPTLLVMEVKEVDVYDQLAIREPFEYVEPNNNDVCETETEKKDPGFRHVTANSLYHGETPRPPTKRLSSAEPRFHHREHDGPTTVLAENIEGKAGGKTTHCIHEGSRRPQRPYDFQRDPSENTPSSSGTPEQNLKTSKSLKNVMKTFPCQKT